MNDPRQTADFDTILYPQCDNAPPPPWPNASIAEARKLEFLTVYYQINQARRALLSVRAKRGSREEEHAALQGIEHALLARDALEDKYSSIGMVATPQFENGFVKNVSFVQPIPRVAGSSLSMLFAVPRLPPAS